MKDFTITHIGESELSLPMPFKYIPAKGKTFIFQADDGSNLGNKSEGVPITFENDFWMCAYPTTQEFWSSVSNEGNQASIEDSDPSFFKGKHRPVERISWKDTVKFLKAINQLIDTNNSCLKLNEGDLPNGKFRLPSETQWEYAANANQGLVFAGSQNLNDVAWYSENSNDQTMPVGLKQPNAWGLYDMSGNVWEWCADDYLDDHKNIPKNGLPNLKSNSFKSLRGGGFFFNAGYCRLRDRGNGDSGNRGRNYGFRLVFSPSSSVSER